MIYTPPKADWRSGRGRDHQHGRILSAGKAHFNEVNRKVADHHDRVSFTTNGVEETVLVAKADLEALEETIAILGDSCCDGGQWLGQRADVSRPR